MRWRRIGVGAFLLVAFSAGFYLAYLYTSISALIEQRRAALSSTIYSAPFAIQAGDDLNRTHLADRLDRLAYARVAAPGNPGEYSITPAILTLYRRSFHLGVRELPAVFVRVTLDGDRISAVTDSFGVGLRHVLLESEVVGRLMPGAPAERVEVRLDELKPYVVKGLLATEDRYFYYHLGVDPIRIVEAAIADFRAHRLEQGASTITQQLARTFIPREGRSFRRKFRELAIALVLELRLSKDEILTRYVNDVDLGESHGSPIYGLPMAARDFFNKDLREVSPAEAATLIAMIRAPTLYDPRRHPDFCRARRNAVLGIMRDAGVIDGPAYHAAVNSTLDVAKDPGARHAPYFADFVTAEVAKIPGFDGHLEGLQVFTTLDPELQIAAESAIAENAARIEHEHPHLARAAGARLESSLAALDVHSGAIRAMVGGRDYGASQYNRAAMAQRQAGSAFKPIVYLAALDPDRSPLAHPLTLASLLPDRPMSFNGWTPTDYEGTYRGAATVADAIADSLNVPAAYVGSMLGPARMIRTAHELGIHEDLPAVLPIADGAGQMTLLELTSAYQVFAGGGVARPPYAIDAVVDRFGHLIYQHQPDERRVARADAAYLITAALQGVLRYGTGASAARLGLDFPVAGKTGTTNDYKDAYFVGYTPEIACGVWVGFDQPRSLGLTGAQAALPAWVKFMTAAQVGVARDFEVPAGITFATIDPTGGGLATASCPRAIALPFLSGSAPTQPCTLHSGLFAARTTIAPPSPVAAAPDGAPPPRSNSLLGPVASLFRFIFGR